MRKEVKIGGKIKAADYFMSITFSLILLQQLVRRGWGNGVGRGKF